MAGNTRFPFSNSSSSSSSTPSFDFATTPSSSSTPYSSFTTNPFASSVPHYGFATPSSPLPYVGAPPSFGSSFSPPPTTTTSSHSTTTKQNLDNATVKSIIEAVEILEKTEGFPKQTLQQIKQELEKIYPNIFQSSNNNNNNNNNSQASSEGYPNKYNNNSFPSINSYINNQQEFYNNIFQNAYQQQLDLIQMQTQIMQNSHMNVFGATTPGLSPNYYGNFPSYHTNNEDTTAGAASSIKMMLEMMGNTNNNGFSSGASFGSDGFSALSFLGSFLGGFGF